MNGDCSLFSVSVANSGSKKVTLEFETDRNDGTHEYGGWEVGYSVCGRGGDLPACNPPAAAAGDITASSVAIAVAFVLVIIAVSAAVWVKRSSAAQISVAKKETESARKNAHDAQRKSSEMGHEVDALKISLEKAQTIITKQASHLFQ